MDLKNNRYKDQIDSILENYFANITADSINDSTQIDLDSSDADLAEAIQYGLSQLDEELTEDEYNSLRPGDFILVKQFQKNYDPTSVTHLVRPFLITHFIGDRAFGFTVTTTKPDQRYLLQYLEIDDYADCGLTKPGYLELESCTYYKRLFMRDKTADNKICLGHITDSLKHKLIIRMQQISSTKHWLDDIAYYPNKIVNDIQDM